MDRLSCNHLSYAGEYAHDLYIDLNSLRASKYT